MLGRGEVVFSWVLDASAARRAFAWHRKFAENDNHIFPRTAEQYHALIKEGRVVGASSNGEFLGLTYYCLEGVNWELGGLMVADSARGRGIGLTLARVALGHLFFDEDPFADGGTVIAHVHAENQAPRKLLGEGLKLTLGEPVTIRGDLLPGLKQNADGNVVGDVYELTTSEPLRSLRDWALSWQDKLPDGSRARINLGEAITLKHWAEAFMQLGADFERRANR